MSSMCPTCPAWITRLAAAALVVALGACISSPTPHPGQEDLATHDTYSGPDSTGQAGVTGPDLDKDGVPDCEQYGGLWDEADARCLGGTPSNLGDADVSDDADSADVPDDAVDGADDAVDEGDVGPTPVDITRPF